MTRGIKITRNHMSRITSGYGARKVEANALVVRPQEGRDLCRAAINWYVEETGSGRIRGRSRTKARRVAPDHQQHSLWSSVMTIEDHNEAKLLAERKERRRAYMREYVRKWAAANPEKVKESYRKINKARKVKEDEAFRIKFEAERERERQRHQQMKAAQLLVDHAQWGYPGAYDHDCRHDRRDRLCRRSRANL